MENNETKKNEEMRELTDEKLAQVSGGAYAPPVEPVFPTIGFQGAHLPTSTEVELLIE